MSKFERLIRMGRWQATSCSAESSAGAEGGRDLPPNSLMILDFADYLDVLSFLSQDLPDFMDIKPCG